MITLDEKFLSLKTEDCESLREGQSIAKQLFEELAKQSSAPVLSANQVGISRRVVVLNIREPLYFVNPEILNRELPISFIESCATFPQKLFRTERFARIVLNALNFKKPIVFGIPENLQSRFFKDDKPSELLLRSSVITEAVYIQQGIDLLDNRRMFLQNTI